MPDIDRTNNTTRRGLKTHIIFDKPRYYDIDLNIIPWPPISNPYDGNSNGILVQYGAFGLCSSLYKEADEIFSLGKMIWPHFLVRVMVTEQIYRSASIILGNPYHKN